MTTKYQFIVLGNDDVFKDVVVETFKLRVGELGISEDMIEFIFQYNFNDRYEKSRPSACLYFSKGSPFINVDILETLIHDAVLILPIVPDLENFPELVPGELRSVNGIMLKEVNDVEAVVSRALEALSLLRISRRLFISYRRVESRSIAIQLYEELDQCGFDVFLDTHSLRPGDQFQDELWHRLVDTDVVVLLDTPGFLESEWTEKELAQASSMSVTVLQLIWPNHIQNPYSKLCYPYLLEPNHFERQDYFSSTCNLTAGTLKSIASYVESLRARSLAARQDNLIQEFIRTANKMKLVANLQPEKFITLINTKGKELAFIPTVGVPQSFTYNQTEELIKMIRAHNLPQIYLLYDHRNIIEKWQKHLVWLDLYLPVKAVKITDIENWIAKI